MTNTDYITVDQDMTRADAPDLQDRQIRWHVSACEHVSLIVGGMQIGEIPRPDIDPQGWAGLLDSMRDKLAWAEGVR